MIDFLTHLHLLAQSPPSADDLDIIGKCLSGFVTEDSASLNCAAEFSTYTADKWNNIWDAKIGVSSPEFQVLMNISRYIAGPAIALWGFTAMKDLARNGLGESWPRIASIVMLVLVLYSNDAELMRQSVLGVRALFNHKNTEVLEVLNAGSIYEQHLSELSDFIISDAGIKARRAQCSGKTSNDEMLECLEAASASAKLEIDAYERRHPGAKFTSKLNNLMDEAFNNPIDAIKSGALTIGRVASATVVPGSSFLYSGNVFNSVIDLFSQSVLAGFNFFAQNVIEMTWLLTALVLPIPLSLAFYPGGVSALTGWTIGFLTVGLFKINLNIATSVIVSMIYERGPANANLDMAILSVGVLFVASLMTAGGGFVLFQGITMLSSGISMGLMRVGLAGVTGGK